jgi:hypothetical protein
VKSPQTAHKYMSVAKDEILSNLAHGQDLPPSWMTCPKMGVKGTHVSLLITPDLQLCTYEPRSSATAWLLLAIRLSQKPTMVGFCPRLGARA